MGKKHLFILGIISLMLVVSSCSSPKEIKVQESESLKPVLFSEKIQNLENGFSYVSYDGDYGFEQFIEDGGASSDSEVMEFLTRYRMIADADLSFTDKMFGCSTVSVISPEGEPLFGRNFDWQNCNALVIKSVPKHGYSSISTVNTDFIQQGGGMAAVMSEKVKILASLYAPLDGMNEKGFCISVNMIQDEDSIEQDTQKPDLTTTTVVRFLLNQASTVEEALSLLDQFDLHSSMGMMVHFAMADQTGRSVVVEYIGHKKIVTETPVVTNFYFAEGEKKGIGTEQSHERYDILMERISNKTLTVDEVRDALDRVSKHNFNDASTTEWSAIFNQSSGEVRYYHRENYSKGYLFQL